MSDDLFKRKRVNLVAELAEMQRYLTELCPEAEADRFVSVAEYVDALEAELRRRAKLGIDSRAKVCKDTP